MHNLSQYLPKALIVTLCLIACIEGSLYVYSQNSQRNVDGLLDNRFYPPNRIPALEESIIQWQVYHALNVQQPIDILFLGDSSALMGLRPTLIQARTGLTCWDIGTLDYLSTPGNVDILEMFLRQHPTPPKVVVYHIISWSFSLSQSSLQQFGYIDRLQKWVSLSLSEKKNLSAGNFLPSMQYRRTAQRLLTTFSMQENEAWLNSPRGPYPSDNEIRQTLLKNQGAMTEVVRADSVDQYLDLRRMLRIDPSIVAEIRRLIDICARASIRLIFVTNPIPNVAETAENREGLTSMEAQLQQIVQGNKHVTFYTPFARFYPVELCNSYNHLTEAGAIRNSEEVSQWLLDNLHSK